MHVKEHNIVSCFVKMILRVESYNNQMVNHNNKCQQCASKISNKSGGLVVEHNHEHYHKNIITFLWSIVKGTFDDLQKFESNPKFYKVPSTSL